MKASLSQDKVGSETSAACLATLPAHRTSRLLKATLLAPAFFLVAGLAQLSAAVSYTPVSFTDSVGTGELPAVAPIILTLDLPGTAELNFVKFSFGTSPRSNFFQIDTPGTFSVPADVYSSLYYWHSLNLNETWADLGGQTTTSWGANISRMEQTGTASFLLRSEPTYLPFRFTDTTDSTTKYGYVSLSTSVTGSGPAAQMTLNVSGYAYDNSGAEIAMGAVPEPSTAISAALGIAGMIAILRFRRKKSMSR